MPLVANAEWRSGVDNILSMTIYGGTTQTYYYVKDHLGSVQTIVDASGAVVESYQYDAWGNVLGVYDSSGNPLTSDLRSPTSALGNRFCWQGREISWATRLYYFRARWYEPLTGRWLSNDPIGISGGLNQYVFCNDNGVNYTDPDGLWTLRGHRNLGRYGNSRFDYGRLDISHPASLFDPGGHFMTFDDAMRDAIIAASRGDCTKFEYAVHSVQDFYSHVAAGVTGHWKHVKRRTAPDNPARPENRARYQQANETSLILEAIWDYFNPLSTGLQ